MLYRAGTGRTAVNEQQCSTQMEAVMETAYENECSTVPEQVRQSTSIEQHCSAQSIHSDGDNLYYTGKGRTVNENCSAQMYILTETIYENGCSTMQEQVGGSISSIAPPKWRR